MAKRRAVGYRGNGVLLAERPSPRVGLEVGEVAEVEWGHRLSESLVSLVRPGRPHLNLEASPALVVSSPRLGTLWWPGSLFQPAPSSTEGVQCLRICIVSALLGAVLHRLFAGLQAEPRSEVWGQRAYVVTRCPLPEIWKPTGTVLLTAAPLQHEA